MKGSRQFQANLPEFDSMMQWIREVFQKTSWDSSRARKFELALEEALVNIIYYAYPNPSGIVEVLYEADGGKLSFTIKDQGVAYNPLDHDKPLDKEASLEERDAGGLGIYFIKNLTDDASYQRADGWNVLTLIQKK